ncbi:MAG: hypothetical protein ABIR68_08775 [Ilumatobacteraceae bacterium]
MINVHTKKQYMKVALIALSLTAGMTAAIATPASALVTENDAVLIDGNGFSFGGTGYAAGTPTSSGNLEWDQAWYGVIPTLAGRLHIEGDNDCARVRLISYNSSGAEVSRVYSNTECAPDNDHISWPVEVEGSVGSPKVLVTVQSENSGGWSNVGSQTLDYGPAVDIDSPLISRATYDFGTGNFVGGSPASPGTLTWTTSGSGVLTPRLTGTLYMNDTENCARMRMRFSNASGGELAVKYGGTVCGHNDELKKYTVDLAPYSSSAITEVHISIQEFDASPPPGAWMQIGATVMYLS